VRATSSDLASQRAIVVSVVIERPPSEVWSDIRDIGSHVDWMHDAVAIRFVTESTEGVGTRFECDTKVGPLSTTDVMEITEWEPERRMGVRHIGLVEGVGEFSLVDVPNGTEFRWSEDLRFPWFMGGALGAFAARPILRWIWSRNLRALKVRIESSRPDFVDPPAVG
jgi:hypothetical protein